MVIKIDNTSSITLVKNPVSHGGSKHRKSRYQYVRACVEEKEIPIEHVSGKEQWACILKKALAKIMFIEIHKLLGIEDLSISIRKLGG